MNPEKFRELIQLGLDKLGAMLKEYDEEIRAAFTSAFQAHEGESVFKFPIRATLKVIPDSGEIEVAFACAGAPVKGECTASLDDTEDMFPAPENTEVFSGLGMDGKRICCGNEAKP